MWIPFRKRRAKAPDIESGNGEPTVDRKGFLRWPGKTVPRLVKGEHMNAYRLAREAFHTDRPQCPDCKNAGRHGVLIPIEGQPDSRQCSDPDCGMVITLRDLAAINAPIVHFAPEARQAYFIKQATLFFVVACAVLSVAVLYSSWQGSWFMFLAAIICSVPVFAGAFAMRYRAWQVKTNRFYEPTAPFGDFIRDEIEALRGRGSNAV